MDEAYGSSSGLHTDGAGNLFVSGTRDFGDVVTDVFLPFGSARRTRRYREARQQVQTGEVTHVYGHSLGGFIAHALAEDFPGLLVDTYDAPLTAFQGVEPGEMRYRDSFDPVSMFDPYAIRLHGFAPHSLSRA